MDIAWYVISFVVAIGVLVTVHEFGHFWVARRLGVKVLRFSIGFGRPVGLWRRGPDETEYVLAAVPLGGYVKMLDEREGDVASQDLHRAFNRQRLAVRTAIVLAGPVANFLFAIFAYWLMFVIGVSGPRPIIGEVNPDGIAARAGLAAGEEIVVVAGVVTPTWEDSIQAFISRALDHREIQMTVSSRGGERDVVLDLRDLAVDDLARGQFFAALGLEPFRPEVLPVIGDLEARGPAERDGLRPGDRILTAGGQPIDNWSAWVEYVRARPEQTFRVGVERDGTEAYVDLTPARESEGDQVIGRIGAGVRIDATLWDRYYTKVRHGPLESVALAIGKTIEMSALTLKMFWKMLKLEVSLENLSGPLSIAQYAGHTAKVGFSEFVKFLAIVSISLGILNLLPIPVLDGGHLMYYLIELAKGRPLSEEAQFIAQRFGIAMLFGLMGLAFYNDLVRLFG